MIPQNWLDTVENQKTRTYEEASETFKKVMPKDIKNGYQAEDKSYWKDWYSANFDKNKGWNENTYFCNIVGTTTTFHPQGKFVADYVSKQIERGWTEFQGFQAADMMSSIVNENSGNITNDTLTSYKQQYQQELNSTSKKKKKEELQELINKVDSNLKLVGEWKKEVDNYWTSWDAYSDMWYNDLEELLNKWNEVLEKLKNPEPEEEPEEEQSEEQVEEPKEEESPNAIASAEDNTYSNIAVDSSQDVSINKTHTRIYEYRSSTIQLDEMSIPVVDDDGSNATIDPSTGQHLDASAGNLSGVEPYKTSGNRSPQKSMEIGFSYPLLRINEHYFSANDIAYFELASVRFLPTIEVKLECSYNDLLKSNMIKDGDKCSVFINPGHGSIKSYRGDFQITHVRVSDMDQFVVNSKITIRFTAELYIPTIYDATQTFAFSGSSRDALIDAAEKLGLGFFFSDPENTNDAQMWYSMSDGEQKTNEMGISPAIEYIQNTAKHSYKNFESFYDCWIDPRYAITFINVAQMLGGAGLDEPIDLAMFNTTQTYGKGADAENREETAEQKAKRPRPQVKLLTNVGEDEASFTSFLVTSYSEKNDGSITNRLGFSNANYISIKNPGFVKAEDNSIEMNLSIPVNADKLKHGFFIMAGPGQNLTYTEGKNGSYVEQHTSKQGGTIAETQSDGDAEEILESGNNMLASGNTNKFYETAEGHNMMCNMWLKKKTVHVTLNGCNMQMMRGEKIPMLLRDNFNPATSLALGKDENKMTYQKILVTGTGWFIIKSIKWIYDINSNQKGTSWRTELVLTRREWPIPDYVKDAAAAEQEEQHAVVIENDVATGTTKDAVQDQQAAEEAAQQQAETDAQNASSDDMTTNGLNSYLVNIYNEIKQACSAGGASIMLVSGRRWPVDEEGNVVNEPVVQNGNHWKFKNAKGDIVWYASKTSPHSTGDAMDIINGEGTAFEDVLKYIVADDKILYDMITNGVYLGKEVSSDGGNSIIHYHIGKVDKSNANTSKVQAGWWNAVQKIKQSVTVNGHEVQLAQYQAYSH